MKENSKDERGQDLQKPIFSKGKQFSMEWDSESNVLFVDIWGILKKENAEDFRDKFHEIYLEIVSHYKLPGDIFKMFVDTSEIKMVNHEARRIFTEVVGRYTQKTVAAVCSPNTLIRIATNFLLAVGRNHVNAKFFKNKEESLRWLKSITKVSF
jgi:hypothetical protein